MARSQVRASGKSAGTEVAEREEKELLEEMVQTLPEDDPRSAMSSLGFTRMKLDFTRDERVQMDRIKAIVDGIITRRFMDAHALMNDLFDTVRTHEVNPDTGEMMRDGFGLPVWVRTATGAPEEDWSRLTRKQREDFLFRITTQIYRWEQEKADLWGEAMYAKAMWTEEFSIEYDRSMSGTIEDRTAAANRRAAEAKYFAIFSGQISKKADGIVRSMRDLSKVLTDSLTT
jgi:hypothetical protein